jgi:23S rRNA (uracil1939-C5)-methyltransferase
VLELKIEKMIYGGDGLARLPANERGRGKAVFLPFVLENERVEVVLSEEKPGFSRAHAVNFLETSQYRSPASCPYFGACGGCHYQHSTYEHQLEIKASILKENLLRMAKLELSSELKVHPSPPWNYRNRTRMRVGGDPEFALGYYKHASHQFLAVEQCPISSPLINRAIKALSEVGRAQKFNPGLREIELFANADDEHLLVEAYCGRDLKRDAAEALALALQAAIPEAVGVTVFPEPTSGAVFSSDPEAFGCTGASALVYKTQGATYRVSMGSFFQTNRHVTDELVRIVTQGRSGRTALDLYAGVGLFSVVLSREFERIIAVESSLQSHADLTYNVPANVKTVRSTVEQYLARSGAQVRADLIVVDPPRGGLGERVIKALVALNAPNFAYVSCDPATLARDLVLLLASGHHVEQAHLVDLFPQTFHVESVFYLTR